MPECRSATCEKINVIIGRGLHSKKSIPLLKLTLENELTQRGYRCRVMANNPGILEVFPYQVERREPTSGGCVVTRSARLKPQLVIEKRSAN
jgi:hypothetical protein